MTTINVTPNFKQIFSTFMHNAQVHGHALLVPTDPQVQEEVKSLLVSLSIAAYSISDAEDFKTFREQLKSIADSLAKENFMGKVT